MKNRLAIILILCALLSLCACGKSEEAEAVDALILAIADVALDDKETIQKAQEEYDLLSDKQKQTVESYPILAEAIETLSILEEEEAKRLEEEALRKAEEARIKNNCETLLNWLVSNGEEILEEDDINKYGQVKAYEYVFQSDSGSLYLSVEPDEDGKFDDITRLDIRRLGVPSHYLYTYLGASEMTAAYLWGYHPFMKDTDASGWINDIDLAQVSRSNTDYEISGYKESYDFKADTGYTDVKAVIIEGLFETIDMFAVFLESEVGMDIADLGFYSYT